MTFETTDIKDVLIVRPKTFPDSRGYFRELTRTNVLAENGITEAFVQTNNSFSTKGVIRGMHYQLKNAQSKLVCATYGEIYDVIIDIRKESPTFGKWVGVNLSAERGELLYVPKGFAHGFQVLTDFASVVYQCSDYFTPGDEYGINCFSKALGIDWKDIPNVISEKDKLLPDFSTVSSEYFL